MSELAEVRRYWPRARVQWRDEEATSYCVPGAWCIVRADSASTIIRDWSGRESHIRARASTIAEAMRAAGFGVRPLGEFARHRQRRQLVRQQSADLWGFAATLTGDDLVRLADLQRPRKGVRMGRRKRSGADKEDARQFAQWRARWTSCR